jgi:hypothetical protein
MLLYYQFYEEVKPRIIIMSHVFVFSIFILICTLILTLFLILPLGLLVTGIKRKRNVRIVVATVWLALSCSLALLAADSFSSRHERILDNGQTPDGHEYVLFQTCKGEPYQVELFVRNEQREWQFFYVDHEVWPWRNDGRVEFREGKARIFCGDREYRTIDLEPSADVHRLPATMTAEEVFESGKAH